MRLVKAELRKIRTTNLWWILLLAVVAFTALAFFFNAVQAHDMLAGPAPVYEGMSPEDNEQLQATWKAQANHEAIAAGLYTSGQYFGLLFTMVLGILLVTNEYLPPDRDHDLPDHPAP